MINSHTLATSSFQTEDKRENEVVFGGPQMHISEELKNDIFKSKRSYVPVDLEKRK